VSEQEEDYEFTLNEKMHLSLNRFKKVMGILFIILFFTLLFSGMAMFYANDVLNFVKSSTAENAPLTNAENVLFGAGLSIIVVISGIIWYGVKGRNIIKDLGQLNTQFIRQSYLQNIETVTPKGKTRQEKLFSQLVTIFPEVRKVALEAEEDEDLFESEKKIGERVYDMVISTDEGALLVEFFNKKITFEEIEKLVKNTKKQFKDKDKDLFRVICVGTEYDKIFSKEELVSKMDGLDRHFSLDLIIEDEKGYSMIWID